MKAHIPGNEIGIRRCVSYVIESTPNRQDLLVRPSKRGKAGSSGLDHYAEFIDLGKVLTLAGGKWLDAERPSAPLFSDEDASPLEGFDKSVAFELCDCFTQYRPADAKSLDETMLNR